MSQDYMIGDLVWAKMKHFPPWPAKIVSPKLDVKPPKNKKAHFVFFLGTEDFAWIRDEHITPDSESILNTQVIKKMTPTFRNAVDALLALRKNNKEKRVPPKKEKKVREARNFTDIKVKVVKDLQIKQEKKVMKIKPEKKVTKRSGSLNRDDNKIKKERKLMQIKPEKRAVKRSQSLNQDNNKKKESDYESPKKRKRQYKDDVKCSSCLASTSASNADTKYDEPGTSETTPEPLIKKKIGFIGLGPMGAAIVENLLKSGHNVTLWNRTLSKCKKFRKFGAKYVETPAELIVACDITFCCVTDSEASRSIVFSDFGILTGLQQSEDMGLIYKGYVEMSSLDPETSFEISQAVEGKHGNYLAAPICGTSKNVEDGSLFLLAAGNYPLFVDCQLYFSEIAHKIYYLSCEVEVGAKLSVILSALSGTVCGALSEAIMLYKELNVSKSVLVDMFCDGPFRCDNLSETGEMLLNPNLKAVSTLPLKHMQKDLNICLLLGEKVAQHLPIFSAVNEKYTHATSL